MQTTDKTQEQKGQSTLKNLPVTRFRRQMKLRFTLYQNDVDTEDF